VVAQGSLTQGKVPREKRRAVAGLGGNRESRDRDLPRAASLAKHQAGAARLTVGKAQTEHENSPCSSRPNVAIKPVGEANPV
jgi:hypothetical protein